MKLLLLYMGHSIKSFLNREKKEEEEEEEEEDGGYL